MNIDELVKQQLENFEAPMPEASWARMNQNLDQMAKPSGGAKWPWIAAGIVAVAGISALLLMTGADETKLAEQSNVDVAVEVVKPNLDDSVNEDEVVRHEEVNGQAVNNYKAAEVIENPKNEITEVLNDKANKVPINENQPKIEVAPSEKQSIVNNSAAAEIEEIKPLEVSLSNPKVVYCVGQPVKLDIQGGGGLGSYRMNVTGGTGQMNGNEFIPYSAGTYQISVSSKYVGFSGVHTEQKQIEIRVEEAGVANLNVKYNDFASRPVHTFAASGDVKKGSAVWLIDGKTIIADQTDFFFRTRGSYDVILNYVSENGCSGKAKETVYIQDNYNLLAPSSISLSITGKDVFIPMALTAIDLPFTMTILSQNGTVVYKTTDSSRPWDGMRHDNGTMARAGEMYLWKVILTNEKGHLEEYGDVIFVAP